MAAKAGGEIMMNAMNYKGYKARIEFDPRDNIFVGRILGIEDSITFHGETVSELRTRFTSAINHYVADCQAMGRKPLKPASGKLMLRIPPEIHAKALVMSRAAGKSLNQWAAELFSKADHSAR
jgi:predicted HicB family RNase H-like nuclease